MQQTTNELRRAAFMAYPEATVQYKYGHPNEENKMVTTAKVLSFLSVCNKMCVGDGQLILTDLSRMEESHRKEVCRILEDKSDEELFDMDEFNEWMEEIFNGNSATYADYVSGNKFSEIIDYLRSKNYNLPFRNTDLVAAGIAVLKA